MKKHLVLILFAVVAAVQITVPTYMIVRHENTLRHGERYLFRCAPVDPEDAFRGRYVALAFLENEAVVDTPGIRIFETAYAEVQVGEDGFARLRDLYHDAPKEGAYLRVKVGRIDPDSAAANGQVVPVTLPFDRYYMEESLAKKAEEAYRKVNREARAADEEVREVAHVAVRVQDGYAVIEELYLNGVPVREHLEER